MCYLVSNTPPTVVRTYPRVLERYVREEIILKPRKALRKITSFPTQELKLFDEGASYPGAGAAIVIFDPGIVIDGVAFQQACQYPNGISGGSGNGQVSAR